MTDNSNLALWYMIYIKLPLSRNPSQHNVRSPTRTGVISLMPWIGKVCLHSMMLSCILTSNRCYSLEYVWSHPPKH